MSDERTTKGEPDLSDPKYYLNRELSELEYQSRVLHEAEDDRNPILERVRFLAYFTKNTDEFFMKRVGGLKQQIEADITDRTVDGWTPEQQWREVLEKAGPMFHRQTEVWENELKPALADAGIHILDYGDLTEDKQADIRAYFRESILPTLTPLSFDPAHPFPFISNLSLSLGILTRREDDAEPTFTRVKVPPNQPRLVEVHREDDESAYVLAEDVIEANIDVLLPSVDIIDVSKFRLTRNAEVRRDEEVAEDLVDAIEDLIEQRRFAKVVRLEVAEDMPDRSLDLLVEQLNVDRREVYHRSGPIDFEDFFSLMDLDRPNLKTPAWSPRPHPRLDPAGTENDMSEDAPGIFTEIKRGDILVHHPYHSFETTVQRFLTKAAADPQVLAVKAAIYRTASDSKVIQSLIDAADNGKQVAVMVELKARFDERNNLEWVRRLEEEGIHVAYGTVGLKTHTKTALVVRQEGDSVTLYSHVGTGNYHSETAKGYVDLGILTADRDIGQDLVKVFNFFTGPSLDEEYRKLLIAPETMRETFTDLIRQEAEHAKAGRGGRLVVKINGLEDPEIVGELYRASMAGVEIDLFVRDICRLRPDVDGLSENITVHSIVGRFLEHSRIFYFENDGDPEWYIGSADWMTRNLDYRVEAVAPVESPTIRRQLRFVFSVMFADNRRRWVMAPDGSYEQVQPDGDEPIRDTQSILMEQTRRATDVATSQSVVIDDQFIDEDLLVNPSSEADNDTHLVGGDDSLDVLDVHSEHWYVPNSDQYAYAVRTPEGDRRYLKTQKGAIQLLEQFYD